MNSSLQPVIKWSGSKRKLSKQITKYIPENGTYFEPFLGGGAILGAVGPRKSHVGDVIPELIELWLLIQREPTKVSRSYRKDWLLLQETGHLHFNFVRERFNKDRKPTDLLFLSRTCVNGLIRFNKIGDFNNSFHHTRPGIEPGKLEKVILEWSQRISLTQFHCADFHETLGRVRKNDVVYLDPPYVANRGRYEQKSMDFPRLWDELERLNTLGAKWILSLDGKSGDRDYSDGIKEAVKLSKTKIMLKGETSAFPRLLNSRQDQVFESVLMNF